MGMCASCGMCSDDVETDPLFSNKANVLSELIQDTEKPPEVFTHGYFEDEKRYTDDSGLWKISFTEPPGYQSMDSDLQLQYRDTAIGKKEAVLNYSNLPPLLPELSDKNQKIKESFTSIAADQFEHDCSLTEGECLGIMPWDICWLRGDEGNAPTDYHETMYVAEEIMAPRPRENTLRRPPMITNKVMRHHKKEIVDAYLEAIPFSRRRLSMVTVGVDMIWKEVTTTRRGKLEVSELKFRKELAWLRARRRHFED